MSIYATLWTLKFPRHGDETIDCEWTEVTAQGVPAHIGSPAAGLGYEEGDPYASFLPPALVVAADDDGTTLRAVVFITEETAQGTEQSQQEYVKPLLVLSGEEYAAITFSDLHERLRDALRGERPRVIAEILDPDGGVRVALEDGTIRKLEPDDVEPS